MPPAGPQISGEDGGMIGPAGQKPAALLPNQPVGRKAFRESPSQGFSVARIRLRSTQSVGDVDREGVAAEHRVSVVRERSDEGCGLVRRERKEPVVLQQDSALGRHRAGECVVAVGVEPRPGGHRFPTVDRAVDQPPQREPWGLVEMCVRDPDGVRIAVVEVPDDHPLRYRP